MNNIKITGRLTADPELKTTPNGTSVTSFSVAVDRSYKGPDGEKLTDFFNVVAWRSTAEFICKYFSKGRLILIDGEMQSSKYTDKDGNNRIAWELLANKVEFMGDKPSGNSQTASDAPAAQNTETSAAVQGEITDDDYPF